MAATVEPQPLEDSSSGVRQRLKKRSTPAVEFKNAQHMEKEDKRVKQLTESVLYEFLPQALGVMLPHCEDPLQDLDAGRCRAVAGAALAVATLLNAPPGFLEFLLCVPWRKLTQLYPKSEAIDKLISNLHVTDEERRRLVNVRMDPALIKVVLDFIYRPEHLPSLPPMLMVKKTNTGTLEQATDDLQGVTHSGTATLETVAAVLDGATPLHCAALRGNPAQVDHLLFCGADPTVRTTAGELPIQLVPVCDMSTGGCRCMSVSDQEKWECKSRLSRSLIAQRSIAGLWQAGVWGWLKMLMLCLLCVLGIWGNYTTLCRPVIEQHVLSRRERKKQSARVRALNLMLRMRAEAQQGHVHLAAAKQEAATRANGSPWKHWGSLAPDAPAGADSSPSRIDLLQCAHRTPSVSGDVDLGVDSKVLGGGTSGGSTVHDINVHLKESEAVDPGGEEQPSEKAFKCFVRAVHSLQSLDLQGETIAQVLNEPTAPGEPISPSSHVLEDEQALLYCCWAESVMLKFGRTCTCPGCAALAVQAVRMAHAQTSKLYQRAESKHGSGQADRVKSVGHCLARVVHVYITLLLDSEAQTSPTRASVWRAEQCLREWDRLVACGLADEGFSQMDLAKVAALRMWARTADSDLYIAEALLGSMLGPAQSLQEVLAMTVTYSDTQMPYLARGVNTEVVHQLEQALTLALLPSPTLSRLAKSLVVNSAQELAVGARLREVISSTRVPNNEDTVEYIASLTDIISKAEVFPRLAGDVAICRNILDKHSARADAVCKLMSVMEDVRTFTTSHPLLPPASHIAATATVPAAQATSADKQAAAAAAAPAVAAATRSAAAVGDGGAEGQPLQYDLTVWDEKLKQLEAAIQEAKEATIGVAKAKRLLKELQAQATAAKAASELEVMLSKRPAGPAALKTHLVKAEGASGALSSIGLQQSPVGQAIQALVQCAKRRLDVERALDALNKACVSCKGVSDLPKLEAAIINARKVGSEDLDPDMYRQASDLRAKLTEAVRAKGALDTALKAAQKSPRIEDADLLEKAISDASRWEDLLAADLARGRDALAAWKSQLEREARLTRALQEGVPLNALSRAITDAQAAGVKVQHARKVFKLLQSIEQALNQTGDGPAALLALLRSRIEAAEQGGVPTHHPVMTSAQQALRRLLAADARDALELALKPSGREPRAWERQAALRAALAKAEEVVGAAVIASVCQDSVASAGSTGGALQSPSGSREASVTSPAVPGDVGAARVASGTSTGAIDSEGGVTRHDSMDTDVLGSDVVGSMISVTISDDDADMAMLLELARRARLSLEDDMRELARQDAERAAAEREKRERQDKEKARVEQERKQRDQDRRVAAGSVAATERRTGMATDKLRNEKTGRGTKIKVDLASISASGHFAGSSNGVSMPYSAAAAAAGQPQASKAYMPPPPPPPPRRESRLQQQQQQQQQAPVDEPPSSAGSSWKAVIAGGASGSAGSVTTAVQPTGALSSAGTQDAPVTKLASTTGPDNAALNAVQAMAAMSTLSPRAPSFVMPTAPAQPFAPAAAQDTATAVQPAAAATGNLTTWHSQQQQQALQDMWAAAADLQAHASRHTRLNSLETLGDPHLKLDREVLAALEMKDSHSQGMLNWGAVDPGVKAQPRHPIPAHMHQSSSFTAPGVGYSRLGETASGSFGVPGSGSAVELGAGVQASLAAESGSHRSSQFGSAASTEDAVNAHLVARGPAPGVKAFEPPVVSASDTSSTSQTVGKPRFPVVDLGGHTWGMESKAAPATGHATQVAGGYMADFYSILTNAKGAAHGQETGAGLFGWPSGPGQTPAVAGWPVPAATDTTTQGWGGAAAVADLLSGAGKGSIWSTQGLGSGHLAVRSSIDTSKATGTAAGGAGGGLSVTGQQVDWSVPPAQKQPLATSGLYSTGSGYFGDGMGAVGAQGHASKASSAVGGAARGYGLGSTLPVAGRATVDVLPSQPPGPMHQHLSQGSTNSKLPVNYLGDVGGAPASAYGHGGLQAGLYAAFGNMQRHAGVYGSQHSSMGYMVGHGDSTPGTPLGMMGDPQPLAATSAPQHPVLPDDL